MTQAAGTAQMPGATASAVQMRNAPLASQPLASSTAVPHASGAAAAGSQPLCDDSGDDTFIHARAAKRGNGRDARTSFAKRMREATVTDASPSGGVAMADRVDAKKPGHGVQRACQDCNQLISISACWPQIQRLEDWYNIDMKWRCRLCWATRPKTVKPVAFDDGAASDALQAVRGKRHIEQFDNAPRRRPRMCAAGTRALARSSPQRGQQSVKPRRQRRMPNAGLEESRHTNTTGVGKAGAVMMCLSLTDIPWLEPLQRPWFVNSAEGLSEAILQVHKVTRASRDTVGCLDIVFTRAKGRSRCKTGPALLLVAFRNTPAFLFDLLALVPRTGDPGSVQCVDLPPAKAAVPCDNKTDGCTKKMTEWRRREEVVLQFISKGCTTVAKLVPFAKTVSGKQVLQELGLKGLGAAGAYGAVCRLVAKGK